MVRDGFYDGLPGALLPLSEVSARGAEWYTKLRQEIETGNNNRYVAIDVASGEYNVGRSSAESMRALISRKPGAQLFLRKIGSDPEPDLAARVFDNSPTVAPIGRKP